MPPSEFSLMTGNRVDMDLGCSLKFPAFKAWPAAHQCSKTGSLEGD